MAKNRMSILFLWHIGILFVCPIPTLQRSLPSSLSYIGAVVEYTPVKKTETGQKLGDINANNYVQFIKKAEEKEVDIIVFPESSLSLSSSDNETVARSEAASYIPHPDDHIIPCETPMKYASSLVTLSCAAKKYQMYVVINHREKVDCQTDTGGCPADGYLIYNTHLTFDRKGEVISRYRKYNLFNETETNRTAKPEPSIFKTDFNVTFGQFLCFDIAFQSPAVDLVLYYGVTDIVYSVRWFPEMPYAFSNEVQAAWAYATDTNFLSSGHNDPTTGSGGSGIFIGRQGHARVISTDLASNTLIVAKIPKKINGKRLLNIDQGMGYTYEFDKSEISTSHEVTAKPVGDYVAQVISFSGYKSELINVSKNNSTKKRTLCDKKFCCRFDLNIDFNRTVIQDENKFYRYRMVAFNNIMSFAGQGSGKAQICGIIACLNETIESCGKMFNSSEKVVMPTSLTVNIKIPNNPRAIFLPLTLHRPNILGSPLPLNVTEFTLSYGGNGTYYKMRLSKPHNDLLTFALAGRSFS